jgi:peptidoglycan hydrolase FlgJ
MIKPVTSSSVTIVDPKLRKAAQGFEAVFLREIIGSMRKGKLADEMFGSSATNSFREMADARTADQIAKLGQFGIAAMVEKQLGVAQTPAHPEERLSLSKMHLEGPPVLRDGLSTSSIPPQHERVLTGKEP